MEEKLGKEMRPFIFWFRYGLVCCFVFVFFFFFLLRKSIELQIPLTKPELLTESVCALQKSSCQIQLKSACLRPE